MQKRTKQIFTIIICIVIFAMGVLKDLTTVHADKLSLFKIIFG